MNTTTIRITPGYDLAGIRHWFQHLPKCTPRFEVFTYEGKDNVGRYWFRSRRNVTCLISKEWHELNTNGFHAFCLDWGRISKRLEEIDNAAV